MSQLIFISLSKSYLHKHCKLSAQYHYGESVMKCIPVVNTDVLIVLENPSRVIIVKTSECKMTESFSHSPSHREKDAGPKADVLQTDICLHK